MPAVRKILKNPPKSKRNYFLVDASFLANKHIPINSMPAGIARASIRKCKDWWKQIDKQVKQERARVYIPDICIAETSRVLAKEYYNEQTFSFPA
jgi:hypothetical protein